MRGIRNLGLPKGTADEQLMLTLEHLLIEQTSSRITCTISYSSWGYQRKHYSCLFKAECMHDFTTEDSNYRIIKDSSIKFLFLDPTYVLAHMCTTIVHNKHFFFSFLK